MQYILIQQILSCSFSVLVVPPAADREASDQTNLILRGEEKLRRGTVPQKLLECSRRAHNDGLTDGADGVSTQAQSLQSREKA